MARHGFIFLHKIYTRHGLAGYGWVRLGSVWLGVVRCGTVWLGTVRQGFIFPTQSLYLARYGLAG